MENLVFTQLSIPEIKQIFRQELQSFFETNKQSNFTAPEGDQPLTIKQAGELLSLSVPTLYGLVSRQGIPVSKQGKRLYFSRVDLLAWIKSGRKLTISEIDSQAGTYLKKKGGKNA